MSILIKNVLLNGARTDILVDNGRFEKIGKLQGAHADEIFDGEDKAILPAFYNMHTHCAMNLLKGYGDDKDLFDWLSGDIWPAEDKLTARDIYVGTKAGIAEMIRSGTVGFNDMYFEQPSIMQAAAEAGVRAKVAFVEVDNFDAKQRDMKIKGTADFLALPVPAPERVQKQIGVHAVYTSSEEMMDLARKTARENAMSLHIHACETKKEVDDCFEKYGCSPIELFAKHGLLGENTVLAHAVWVNDKDIELVVETKTVLCANPSSNLKLCSGIMPFDKLQKAGCRLTLGTDGASSNNALNMLFEMKMLALASKIQSGDPKAANAQDVFNVASENGARAFGVDAGEIAEGKTADCVLVDLTNPFLTPRYNLISNMVYSADTSCVDSVICAGAFVMKNRVIDWERDILNEARDIANRLKK